MYIAITTMWWEMCSLTAREKGIQQLLPANDGGVRCASRQSLTDHVRRCAVVKQTAVAK
jgi:hypothetical protein